MMARRMLRGAPLTSSSLPLVQSLRTLVTAHASQKHLLSSSCLSRCSSTALPVSKFSRQQSTIHSATCTSQQPALRRSIPRHMWNVPVISGLTTDAAASAADVTPEDVLHYWFKDADLANNKFPMQFWFSGGEAADKEIKEKFGDCLECAIRGELDTWKSTPRGRVALVLVLDQFSRNCHRDTSRGFAQDEAALQIALESIQQGLDQQLSNPLERQFLYMPLMHSESLEVHAQALRVYQKLAEDHKDNPELYNIFQGVVKFEKAHSAVLQKFGRYPSRNAVLGRTNTPEELEYLAGGELWAMED